MSEQCHMWANGIRCTNKAILEYRLEQQKYAKWVLRTCTQHTKQLDPYDYVVRSI